MTSLEQAKAKEGSELGMSDWFVVDQERVNAFADVTGDRQWIHLDPERAKNGPFGSTIAHGFLTLSLVPMLISEIPLPVKQYTMGINYGLDKVRFISPVPVGSRLRARVRLDEARAITNGTQLKLDVTVEVDGSQKPACAVEFLLRLYE